MDPYAYNESSDEEDVPMGVGGMDPPAVAYAAPAQQQYYADKEPRAMEDDEDDDDDEDAMVVSPVVRPQPIQPRGKPEAMSTSLMQLQAAAGHDNNHAANDDEVLDEVESLAEELAEEDDVDSVTAVPIAVMAQAAAASSKKPPPPAAAAATPATKKKAAPKSSSAKKKAASGSGASKAAALKRSASPFDDDDDDDDDELENFMEQEPPPITEEEYTSLDSLMEQFCRVPLLAEFSRPVKLLHPELASVYSKIVTHPVDLGYVCRGIRRRQYRNMRDIRLDMWRVFGNCVKFHSHPNNKEKVPSFVSIALHLREYFNSLWQEYMLPSEILDDNAPESLRQAFQKRAEERKKRLENSGVLMMSKKFLTRVARLLGQFIAQGGRTDILDKQPLFEPYPVQTGDAQALEVRANLTNLQMALQQMADRQEEYSIDDFNRRLQECYSQNGLLEANPALRNRFHNRLDRLVGKLTVPLHEANSRGVTQSSIWGNIATTIWARESGRKPYWPALCLGILPPEDQREGWHAAVTERNEARLPQRLRTQLMASKKKCEAAQKRQSLSYFLVEFLGTHEFVWVKETDIVEKFDPKDDPNTKNIKGKKRARLNISSVVGSRVYTTALEECEWATDEFEQVLQEAFDFEPEKESGEGDDGEFMTYSYALLNQSDEEADSEDKHGHVYDESNMSVSDVEEANWLLAHEGQIDTSTDARKKAKKRTQALRKKKQEEKQKKEAAVMSQKKEKKKMLDLKMKEREEQKEQREIEKRRKKRSRDREKQLRVDMRKNKKKRMSGPNPEYDRDIRGGGFDNKRSRATANIRAYMHRMAEKKEYQGLHLGGSNMIPAATVESSGLLCMALAFRAVAKELDDTDGTTVRPVEKPWESIDTETPLTHQERTAALETKVMLLEREIERLRANTRRRKGLLHAELEKKAKEEQGIRNDEETARSNVWGPVKKKKKAPTKGVGKPFAPPPVVGSSSMSPKHDSGSESTPAHKRDAESGSDVENEEDEEEEDGDDDDDPPILNMVGGVESGDESEQYAVADSAADGTG